MEPIILILLLANISWKSSDLGLTTAQVQNFDFSTVDFQNLARSECKVSLWPTDHLCLLGQERHVLEVLGREVTEDPVQDDGIAFDVFKRLGGHYGDGVTMYMCVFL